MRAIEIVYLHTVVNSSTDVAERLSTERTKARSAGYVDELEELIQS